MGGELSEYSENLPGELSEYSEYLKLNKKVLTLKKNYDIIKLQKEGEQMDSTTKKTTFEDKFARKYYCNSYRFLHDMKQKNRKNLRRKLKKELAETIKDVIL